MGHSEDEQSEGEDAYLSSEFEEDFEEQKKESCEESKVELGVKAGKTEDNRPKSTPINIKKTTLRREARNGELNTSLLKDTLSSRPKAASKFIDALDQFSQIGLTTKEQANTVQKVRRKYHSDSIWDESSFGPYSSYAKKISRSSKKGLGGNQGNGKAHVLLRKNLFHNTKSQFQPIRNEKEAREFLEKVHEVLNTAQDEIIQIPASDKASNSNSSSSKNANKLQDLVRKRDSLRSMITELSKSDTVPSHVADYYLTKVALQDEE